MEDKNAQGQNMYAIIFTIIAILALIGLILLLFWRVQADDSNQNVNIANDQPSVSGVTIYDSVPLGGTAGSLDDGYVIDGADVDITSGVLNLVEDTSEGIAMTALAEDENGDNELADLNNWYVTFRAQSADCGAGPNTTTVLNQDFDDCMVPNPSEDGSLNSTIDNDTLATLTLDTNPNEDLNANPGEQIQYHALPDTWTMGVVVDDGSGTLNSQSDEATASVTIPSLTALNLEGGNGASVTDITFGELALGATSSPVGLVVRNTGNVDIDSVVQAQSDLTCSIAGTIPGEDVHVTLDGAAPYPARASIQGSNQIGVYEIPVAPTAGIILDLPAEWQNEGTNGIPGLDKAFDPGSLGGLTDTADSLVDTFFMIEVPTVGVNGNCSNVVTQTAQLGAVPLP
jgi:hypothetical protein